MSGRTTADDPLAQLITAPLRPLPERWTVPDRVAQLAQAREFGSADGYWEWVARQQRWSQPWTSVRSGELEDFRYFEGGTINVADNCVDRWAEDPATADRRASIWEGEPGDVRTLTYAELRRRVDRLAAGLLDLGVRKGDVVGDLHAQPRRGVHRDPRLQPHRRDLHGAVLRVRAGGGRLAAAGRAGDASSSSPTRATGAGKRIAAAGERCAPRGPGRRRCARSSSSTAPATPSPLQDGEHAYADVLEARRRRNARRAARPERAVVPDLHQRHRVEAEGRGALASAGSCSAPGPTRTGRSGTPTATCTGWPPTSAG